MINQFNLVAQFHETFEIGYFRGPRSLPEEEKDFRVRCLNEEVGEYIEAKTIEAELDAIVDIVYFAMGTAYRQGLDFNEAFKRVHEANMAKELVSEKNPSKRYFHLDVVKPLDWKPPNLKDLCDEDNTRT